MHPTAMHDLAHIRQSEYRREAADHRLATIAKANAGKTAVAAAKPAHGFDLRTALAALFHPRSAPKANAV
jgi:hypothetical protein